MDHPLPSSDRASSDQPFPDRQNLLAPGAFMACCSFAGAALPLLTMGLAVGWYALRFWKSVNRFWFHPSWTTEDSLQQVFPFHKILDPHAFPDDLVTRMMECYLPPLHYALGAILTWLTGSPIMMSHIMMAIQIGLTILMLAFSIRALSGSCVPALFGAGWLLHSRVALERLTGGLPRGWAGPVLAAGLWAMASGRHRTMLLIVGMGCILNPPATMVIAISYGIFLTGLMLSREHRTSTWPHLRRYLLCSPFFAAITLWVTAMPPEIGKMASYSLAMTMREFQGPTGRFPFVPLDPIPLEFYRFGLQSFLTDWYNPGALIRTWTAPVVITALMAMIFSSRSRRSCAVPWPIISFGLGAIIVYLASRPLAFYLYVPNRHLQLPMTIFFIAAFSVGVWRISCNLMTNRFTKTKKQYLGLFGLIILGSFIWTTSGNGLKGNFGFNTWRTKRGEVSTWFKNNTDHQALVAGHPTFIDLVPLFGARRAFITTETAHPFYDRYYAEARRRVEVSLRAFYAPSVPQLLTLLQPEMVTHMVFSHIHFKPEELTKATYLAPFENLVPTLVSEARGSFAYHQIKAIAKTNPQIVPFHDSFSLVVDIAALAQYQAQGTD